MDTLDSLSSQPDRRLSSPATQRNREPIFDILAQHLPESGRVLEIASGSGEHALYFAQRLPRLTWQPSDPSPRAVASVAAWRESGPDNLEAPLRLDVTQRPWAVSPFDALVCINMLHIAPWEASEALLAEAGERLPQGGVLFLYGPYRRGGQHTAPSNAAFDEDLKQRDARWGIRDLEAVTALAETYGLELERVYEMPANNLSLILRRA